MLDEYVSAISWDNIYYMISSNEQTTFLENNISYLYERFVPIKTKTIKDYSSPWFYSSIKTLIKKRDVAHSRWKRFKIPILYDEFRRIRMEVNREIKKSKTTFYAERYKSAIDSKSTWRTIRDIGISNQNRNIESNLSADELNILFSSIPSPNDDSYTNDYINSLEDNIINSQFSFRCVCNDEVLTCLKSLKSNAIGYDNLDPRFVKILLPRLLPYLTHIFNTIFTTNIYPSSWKHAKIIPVPKANSEFRPIAILSYLSKIMEKLMYMQINEFIVRHYLFTTHQSGFRAKHSCVTALINLSEDIRNDIDIGKVTILVLLDHSKAFDTIDHSLLFLKLKKMFGISGTSNNLLKSYLSNRYQSVFINGSYSSALPVAKGVPQGSILGPLLFSLYVNDLPRILSHSKLHLYADDVQIYIGSSVKDIGDNVTKLNKDLDSVYRWATANRLLINPHKSKCIIIHRKTIRINNINIDIKLNNEKIECVTSAKNLGVIFNNNLDWFTHINKTASNIYLILRGLWPTQYFTPLEIKILIAKTYLMPRLLYGCELFSSCDSRSKIVLEKTYNNIIRYVFGLRKFDRISQFSNKLYGMTLKNLLDMKVLQMLHKIIYTKNPPYLYNRITFARSNRGNKIIPFTHRSLISEYQFFIHSVRLWNLLPNNIQTNNNANIFKNLVVNYFIS